MINYKFVKLLFVFFMIFCLVGCTAKKETDNITTEVLINKGFPKDINVTLFYKQYKDLIGIQRSETYNLNNKGLSKTEMQYIQGCYSIFPQKSLTAISNNLGYKDEDALIQAFGQPFIYKKYELGEIFLFEGVVVGKDTFTVFLNIDGKIKTVKINHPSGNAAIGICHEKNDVYVVSSSEDQTEIVLYKIDINNCNLKMYNIPVSNFGLNRVLLYTDSNLVHNNILYVIPKTMDGYTSYILMYNLKDNICKKIHNKNGVSSNIFDMGDKLLVLNRGYTKGSSSMDSLYIDYYDYDLGFLCSEGIPFEKNMQMEFIMRNFCYYYDNKIMGTINSIDDNRKNYVFIYDMNKKQLIYFSKLIQNDEKLLLNDDLFTYKKNNDSYHIF
ncbi:hypothetical protein [Aminipila luticellarii]|nr:hypothetical protein [Aminipila luticellarii]